MSAPIVLRAGRRALEHLRRNGLGAADIAIVPAAAGGPKGLVLIGLDRFVFGEWLPSAPRPRTLVGASIGAWRMAAAAHADPVAALDRLAALYAGQRYPWKPSPAFVSKTCRGIVDGFLDGHDAEVLEHPWHRVALLVSAGRGVLARPRSRRAELLGFAAAAGANALGRKGLARFLDRVVFHDRRDDLAWLRPGFDAFETRFEPLTPHNLRHALLASGSIPLVLEAVGELGAGGDRAHWDGGIIDYHLHLPYPRAEGLVLYPHFADHLVPGWLDKPYRWRRATGSWLESMVLVAPSPEFVASLPNGKLPDRGDFKRYGLDHESRIRDWRRAIAESARLAEAFARWVEQPDLAAVRPFD
jgi:hypothetical protein